MELIKNKMTLLKKKWDDLYKTIEKTPSIWSDRITSFTHIQFNEVVRSAEHLVDQIDQATGFAPIFHFGNSIAIFSIDEIVALIDSISSGAHDNIKTMLVKFEGLLSSINVILSFSGENINKINENLHGKLAESLALLDTAQVELKNKCDILDKSSSSMSNGLKLAENIVGLESNATKSFDNISKINIESSTLLESIKSKSDEIVELKDEIGKLNSTNKKLNNDLEASDKKLQELVGKNLKQAELISDLLPKGASTGLASAFAHRAESLNSTKITWGFVFLASISGLCVIAFNMILNFDIQKISYEFLLNKMVVAAPLVWLGWFSAIQYGNTIRLQEDYSFKEATSKAFAGYRDHMEHMAQVKNVDDGAKTAMEKLALSTITILSSEPGRIYSKAHKDVTPFQSFLALIFRRQLGKEEG